MQVGTYRPVGALVRHALLYTYRSAGAKGEVLDERGDLAPTRKPMDFQYLALLTFGCRDMNLDL